MLKKTPLKRGNTVLKRGNGLKKCSCKEGECKREEKQTQKEEDFVFYQNIWDTRNHTCENCGVHLGREPLTIYFDHILEKSTHPEFRHRPDNIMLLCFTCHSKKTDGVLSEYMQHKRTDLKLSYHKWIGKESDNTK